MRDGPPRAWRLRTLGRLCLHADGPDSEPVLRNAKALGVLAYLATIPGRASRRRHIADLFWPEVGRRRGRRSLRQALYYLSKKAGDELVRSDAGELALAVDRIDVDLWRLDAAVDEGRWDDAVALYGGPFLDGFEGKAGRELEGWIEAENERVWSGLKAAYHALIAEARSEGRSERAVRYARDYVELNPLAESAQVTLIRSLQEAGDDVGAFQAYERYRALLREELGVEPGEEIEAQLGDLRRELLGAGPAAESGSSPGGAGRDGDELESAGRARVGDPAVRSDGGRRPRAASADRRLWIALAALVVAAFSVAAWWLAPRGGGARTAWERVEADLLARRATARAYRWHVRIDEGRVTVDPSPVSNLSLPAPGGRRLARVERTASGPDVIVEADGGGERVVAASRFDEVPLTWSPDGRCLVFQRGVPTTEGGPLRDIALVYRVDDGQVWGLSDSALSGKRPVAWSPTGTHVAFSAVGSGGAPDIHRADADGANPTRLTTHPGRDEEPAWSPDGERIAFVSWRTGEPHLWTMDAGGLDVEQVTFGNTRERSPVWVSSQHLVFASNREGDWDLWSLDVVTRRTRRLTRLGDFERADLRRWHRRIPDRVVDRVDFRRSRDTVGPGQRFRVEAVPVDRSGSPVVSALRSVRLSLSASSRLERDSSWLVAADTGRVEVAANVAGWRADTLAIAVRPLRVRRDLPVVLADAWEEGVDGSRWHVAGTPRPYVTTPDASASTAGTPVGTPPDRAFVSNGDANYGSGVVSRRPIPLERGVTVEFPALLPFQTGRSHQALQLALQIAPPADSRRDIRLFEDPVMDVVITAQDPRLAIVTPTGARELPWPGDVDVWRDYALQVAADGTASLIVDGRLYWRSEPGFVELPREARLALGGRSLGIETLVGPVTVYEGERYVLATGDRP